MPPTPKPEGRRRQRDPQCRSAQEEAEPLNDPKQAHLVAAGSGRVGPSWAEGRGGLSGVGEGLGMQWGRVGPVRAEWGRVGPSRAG